jgi:hypothetical protein
MESAHYAHALQGMDTYINGLYSQSEVILQKFKELSFSTQTITHISQHILQKYAIKRTYPLQGC